MAAAWHGKVIGVSMDSDVSAAATIRVREGATYMWADIHTSDSKLSEFQVQYQAASDGTYFTMASSTSDFTTGLSHPMKYASTDVSSLANASSALIEMEVKGVYNIRFNAAAAPGSDASVNIRWQVR